MMLRAAALLLVGLLAGCGVPLDDGPRAAPPAADYARGSEPPAPVPGTATAMICLARSNRLTQVARRVRPPLTANMHLRLLLRGPTASEQKAGYTSSLSATTPVTGATQIGSLVTVRVGGHYPDTGRTDDVLAFGQVVCTLSSRLTVSAVVFLHDGRVLRVPRGDASLSKGPLTAADYAALFAAD
jgi:hypothetical protein